MARFYEQLVAALAGNQPFTLALISGVKGSSPQRIGAKALFFPDGRIVGTLGGGCLEAEVHARAKRALKTGTPATFEMLLDHDFGWDDGLICGGSVSGLILPHAQTVGGTLAQTRRRDRTGLLGCQKGFFHRSGGERTGRMALSGNRFAAARVVDCRVRPRRPGGRAAGPETGFRCDGF